MAEEDVISWVQGHCRNFDFDVAGVFRRGGEHDWPFVAYDADELAVKLGDGGHLLPLPKEPAALANVLEVAIADHLVEAATDDPLINIVRGSERGYPDLELSGPRFNNKFYALDVKVARRASNKARTQSRITLYTGNTYFKWPSLHWPGTLRPFADYASHLDLVIIYSFVPESSARVSELELIVQPAWKIGSRQRSSTTREYIGAIDLIEGLREGRGEFASPDDFYAYWRSYAFRVSAQVQRQLQRLVRQQQERIAELEGRGQLPTM